MTEYYVWLQLSLGAGNNRLKKALEYFGNAENIYMVSAIERSSSGDFTQNELKRLNTLKIESAQKIISDCKKYGIDIITVGSEKYPF